MAASKDDRIIFFFDIDNCLYKKSLAIHGLMQEYIHKFFVNHLKLNDEAADYLHRKYYTQYGLAIEGLVRFDHINALEYNKEVDDALPLDDILKPDVELRKMLLRIDKTKVKLWLFTNAYVNHGKRVVKLLGIDDLFEGITYCDYAQRDLICKPKHGAFANALRDAQAVPEKSYYVDDSYINIKAAHDVEHWFKTIHYVDPDDPVPEPQAGDFVIRDILDLPLVIPELFLPAPQDTESVQSGK